MFTATGALSDSAPWGDIQRVTYELKTPTDRSAAGQGFVSAASRGIFCTVTTPEVEDQSMLSGVASIKFSCYDGAQWQDTWDTTGVDVREHQSAAGRPRGHPDGREQSDHHAQPIEMLVPIDSQSRTNAWFSIRPPPEAEMKLRHSKIRH